MNSKTLYFWRGNWTAEQYKLWTTSDWQQQRTMHNAAWHRAQEERDDEAAPPQAVSGNYSGGTWKRHRGSSFRPSSKSRGSHYRDD